jgi:hypothetical protein
MAMTPELRRRLVACVRNYQSEQGEQRSVDDLRFAELEDEACALGDALAAGLMEAALSAQAAARARAVTAPCPHCGRPAPPEDEPAPRRVQTRRGEVGWREPQHYCRSCRQAFFPSVPRAGD